MIATALRPVSRPFPNTGIVPPILRNGTGSPSTSTSGDVFESGNTGIVPPWMTSKLGNTGIVPPARSSSGNTGVVPPDPVTKVRNGNTGVVPPWMHGSNAGDVQGSAHPNGNTGIVPPWLLQAVELVIEWV